MEKINIAVVGLGPAGLSALKSLREEGFNAIAFERRDKVGGLWSYSTNTAFTSVCRETVANVSKYICGFSDFPVPKGPQSAAYFESYASHFNLHQHIRYETTVNKVVRNSSDSAWEVHITSPNGAQMLSFDKVVFAHGCEGVPSWPPMPNRHKFKGVVMHGQAYRDPEPFKGKRVLVVGMGNTACEVSLSLRKHTAKLYQSYRRGRIMLMRARNSDEGVPIDTGFTWPIVRLKYCLEYLMPWLVNPFIDKYTISNMISDVAKSEPAESGVSSAELRKRAERRLRDDWHLLPCPSMAHANPIVQEDFIPAMRRNEIVPVQGFRDFVGENQVQLVDDTVVEVEAVIFCTGYVLDFSVMPELEMDGACGLPLRTAEEVCAGSDGARAEPHLPRLFQMMFPPRRASSIAVLSWLAPQEPVWCVSELAAMAVAQTWAAETAKSFDSQTVPNGHRPPALLPSLSEMNTQVDTYHAWFREEWKKDHSMRLGNVMAYPFYRYLHDTAGTGLYDNLDHIFTGVGWRLWWNDNELWKLLNNVPTNSYSWRVFETNPRGIPGCGRKTNPEARKMLKESYEIFEDYKRQVQKKSKTE